MLLGKLYTKKSSQFLTDDKEYVARITLGISTDTFDCDGKILLTSNKVPTETEILECIQQFQGTLLQTPPMFSAKKIRGKKLYELARRGIEVAREPIPVKISTQLLSYVYPFLDLSIACSKGTYIRSIAHEMGNQLGSFGHLSSLVRTRSGSFRLQNCISWEALTAPEFKLREHLRTTC